MTEPALMTRDADGSRSDFVRIATVATAAFLSLLALIRYGMDADAGVAVFVLSVLVVVSRHDLERRIIPNRIVLPAWVLVLAANIAIHPDKWQEWVAASFGAGLFFLAVALVYRGGLGMGDVKFVALIGAALGRDVVTALVIGTFASAAVAAVILLREGSAARKRAIPLGPFLAAGAAIVVLFL
jgi:prepilin signal peptidase PulO-like enzyme (type II secretory pathway)